MTVTTVTDQPAGSDLLRSRMPVTERWIYLDHAAVGPLPQPTSAAISRYAQQAEREGDTAWPQWSRGVEVCRKRAATLLGCELTEIALIPNTTFGINLIANGLRWRAGDNLVVPANEFVSNLLPWRLLENRGVEVRCISGDDNEMVDRVLKSMDNRTRLVSLSWVHYLTGYRADLARICDAVHANGSLFMVDAIQGLGAFSLSLAEIPIDFLAADGHKWMLGPEGAGLMFIRQPRLDELDPIMMGWGSIEQAHKFETTEMRLKNSASRYEGGSANMAGLLGFSESLELLLQAGCHDPSSGFGEKILELSAHLEQQLVQGGAKVLRSPNRSQQSGIVSFEIPGQDSTLVRAKLLEQKIVVSVRHGQLRAAIHAYNTSSEINQLLGSLALL
jgi:cysteine desulfurase / selenocysteine lyase